MEELRPEIDGELVSVELDVEAPDVPADAVTTLEQHDIPLPIEQPRHRDARHPAPMTATLRRGAPSTSAGVATVAAIVFSTSRRVHVPFIASPPGRLRVSRYMRPPAPASSAVFPSAARDVPCRPNPSFVSGFRFHM